MNLVFDQVKEYPADHLLHLLSAIKTRFRKHRDGVAFDESYHRSMSLIKRGAKRSQVQRRLCWNFLRRQRSRSLLDPGQHVGFRPGEVGQVLKDRPSAGIHRIAKLCIG